MRQSDEAPQHFLEGELGMKLKANGQQPRGNLYGSCTTGHTTLGLPRLLEGIKFSGNIPG